MAVPCLCPNTRDTLSNALLRVQAQAAGSVQQFDKAKKLYNQARAVFQRFHDRAASGVLLVERCDGAVQVAVDSYHSINSTTEGSTYRVMVSCGAVARSCAFGSLPKKLGGFSLSVATVSGCTKGRAR